MKCHCIQDILRINPAKKLKSRDIKRAKKNIEKILRSNDQTQLLWIVKEAASKLTNNKTNHNCNQYKDTYNIIKNLLDKQKTKSHNYNHKTAPNKHKQNSDKTQKETCRQDTNIKTHKIIKNRLIFVTENDGTHNQIDIEQALTKHRGVIKEYINELRATNKRKSDHLLRKFPEILELFSEQNHSSGPKENYPS